MSNIVETIIAENHRSTPAETEKILLDMLHCAIDPNGWEDLSIVEQANMLTEVRKMIELKRAIAAAAPAIESEEYSAMEN